MCKTHNKVKKILEGKIWLNSDRQKLEGTLRQEIYIESLKSNPDYVYYFDADEYIYPENIDYTENSYFFRLFDFYITENDINLNYLEREYMGPEYRDIIMLFKPGSNTFFKDRQPSNCISPIVFGGYVKHYGKAISIDEWELTCDYYINIFGSHYKPRWEKEKVKLYILLVVLAII